MFKDKKSWRKIRFFNISGMLLAIFGGFCTFIFGLGMLGFLFDKDFKNDMKEATVVFIVIFVFFLFIFWSGMKRRNLAKKCKYYLGTLNQKSRHSFDELSVGLNRPVNALRKDLELMIKKGLIASAYIENNSLVSTNHSVTGRTEHSSVETYNKVVIQVQVPGHAGQPEQKEPSVGYAETVCRNCGASNRVKRGSSSNCEYCGSHLAG